MKWKVFEYDSLRSTNTTAKQAAASGEAVIPSVFVAHTQSAGRGRSGRGWTSPLGGLWVSFLFKPDFPLDRWPLIPLAAGLGVVAALEGMEVHAALKWPNDVTVGTNKICGILCESLLPSGFVVAGIGLNLNIRLSELPEHLRTRSTSVLEETGVEYDRNRAMEALKKSFSAEIVHLSEHGAQSLLERYKSRCPMLGSTVRIRTGTCGYSAVAKDIAEDGSLVVRKQNRLLKVYAADVSVRETTKEVVEPS